MVILVAQVHSQLASKTKHFIRATAEVCALGIFIEIEEDAEHILLAGTALEFVNEPSKD